MSMLSQIFGGGQVQQVQSTQSGTASQAADQKGNEYLSRLSGGQTVEGKVTDIKGNDVQIELPNGGRVTAHLDNAMSLNQGQTLTFEVRSNSGSQISLTPLYTNLTMDSTAAKALTAAGMTINSQTLAMATAMMESGMNVDSKSLGDMYHALNSMQGADAAAVVEMKQLGLPLNEENYEQYTAFKNYENQISEGMREVADGAISLYEELAAGGEGQGQGEAKALHFMRELTEVFVSEDGTKAEASLQEAEGKLILKDGPDPKALAGELMQLLEKEGVKSGEAGSAEDALRLLKELSAEGDKAGTKTSLQANGENTGAAQQLNERLANVVSRLDGGQEFAALLKQMPQTDENALKMSNALLKLLDENGGKLANKELEAQLRDILHSDEFKTVVKNTVRDSWSLRPEQVADKSNVEQLYQKLSQQTSDLAKTLSQIAEPGSQFAQSLGNMNNNLDFMNQMNQAMQYIQLPLKMNGGETTGDLYVYSDKKSLANKDGNVSAMLHLDMQYMGTVDVYAAISPGNKVSTRFYLESDEMIDFIEQHIHILNERLEKRGYDISTKIQSKDDMKKDGEKGRSLTPPLSSKPILKQSFDMRA